MKQAVVKDSEGKIGSAINYYCQALDYFMPALERMCTCTQCNPIAIVPYKEGLLYQTVWGAEG